MGVDTRRAVEKPESCDRNGYQFPCSKLYLDVPPRSHRIFESASTGRQGKFPLRFVTIHREHAAFSGLLLSLNYFFA
jgi:hypothetical protein